MNPRDALIQRDTLVYSMERDRTRQYLQDYLNDVERKKSGLLITDQHDKPSGEMLANRLARSLGMSEVFYVSDDMTLVCEAASTGLDGLDQYAHDLWPSDFGFLLFERGYVITDVWGKQVVTKALSWERQSHGGRPGTLVIGWAPTDDPRDNFSNVMPTPLLDAFVAQTGARLHVSTMDWLADGMRVGPSTYTVPEFYKDFEDEYDPDSGMGFKAAVVADNPGRIILATLMIMQQKIARKERFDLTPKSPKRARKMRFPQQVTVIRLRHEAGPERTEGESRIEWQHRWLVRGHWRSQPVGPDYVGSQEVSPGVYRARIYISPFIKGPDSKPFFITSKVSALIR